MAKMQAELARLLADRNSDRRVATVARIAMGAVGVLAGVMIVRSLPALVRYVKMERM
jgi:hypothetical protein